MSEPGKSGDKAGLRAGMALVGFLGICGSVFLFDSGNVSLWFKAFHIMAVIAWLAGLFYLPRLFIYHFETVAGSQASDLFKVMETRLYRIIMNPSMMMAWLFGLYVAWSNGAFSEGWLHVKLLGVVALTGVHVYYGRAIKAFAREQRPKSQRHWRMINEAPALLMILIVLMVVLKPF